MTPQRLYQTAIRPALDELAGLGIPSSPQAARFLLAIALQESGLKHRRQVVSGGLENGPAVSFLQGEITGGLIDMLNRPATSKYMKAICEAYNVTPTPAGLWEAIRYQDIVAFAAGRLLLYTLPMKLPETDLEGWDQYKKAWAPGKPKPDTWPANWALASATVGC
jgi:hypothetical protein